MTPGPVPTATPLGLLTWRPRTADDQGLLRALFAASRRAELDLMAADPEQERAFVDLQLTARDRHRDATRPDAELSVVTLDDIAVGQLDLDRRPGWIEVLEIALVPGLRGHGLGRALLGQVEAQADDAGVAVRLNVERDNPARRLYERHGFVVTGSTGPFHLDMERPTTGGRPAPPPVPAPTADAPVAPADVVSSFPTYDDLAPHVGAVVPCRPGGPDLVLAEVEARRGGAPLRAVPYSAVFVGPADAPMGQGTVTIDLPGVGPTAVFLVPIGPFAGGSGYEMVVS